MVITTKRLKLHSPSIVYTKLVQSFYKRNRDHLKVWEPERMDSFYSFDFQFQDLKEQARDFRKGLEYRFWISEKDNPGLFVGSVSLSGIIRGNFRSCFMGYKMDQGSTNRGLMTEACQRVVEFAFDPNGADLHRVEINIVPENLPSIRVAEKIGFTREGYSKAFLRIDGKWKDHLRFARTREEGGQ